MTGERRRRVLVGLSAKTERGPVRLFAALIRLAAFDLDGTIVREGTCVESIARAIGREEECAAFERLEMRDVLAVTAAREAMAKWYRPYTYEELTAGLSDLRLAPDSKEAFALLRRHGIVTAIVSITWSFAVEWFARRLGADYAYGTRLTEGRVEHVWPADKGRWLRSLIERLQLPEHAVAAVGDSEGDRELLEAAGVRYCVGARTIEIADVVHMPQASMLEIAKQVVAAR
jgi:HAD superfamily phosphoserine phosphatase-like hydrolase